jgi:hypothetical protein
MLVAWTQVGDGMCVCVCVCVGEMGGERDGERRGQKGGEGGGVSDGIHRRPLFEPKNPPSLGDHAHPSPSKTDLLV